ncbi:MAG: TRAP transporter small permease subunit [Saprospiraceae bacterium]|jgi:TRAP-type mannitol/chloroaromatic compound transport system permease small subunit|nr:TRAP transporter small permease subunit [Saprospiraceae bacterium]
MDAFILKLEQWIRKTGEYSSWLNLGLVLLICLDVLQRYLMNVTYNWVLDAEWHIFGLVFLLGSAFTFSEDKHVRVDVFYQSFSPRKQALVNLLGSVFLLLPWCLVAVKTCWNYAINSYYIREGSPSPGGLPALYVIKFCIVFCFVLLLLQSLVVVYRNTKILLQ